MKIKTYYIYILFDPTFISKTYYVGYTYNPKIRLRDHINDKDSNIHKANWIAKLIARGVLPEIYLVCHFAVEDDALRAEMELISFCKLVKIKLCNILPGGNKPPYKAGENHHAAKLTKAQVYEIRYLFFEQRINRKELAEKFDVSRENIRDIITYNIWNHSEKPINLNDLIEYRNKEDWDKFHQERVGEKHPSFGKSISNETRQKLSESHKDQVAWNKGLKMSDEICEKNSQSHIGQIAWNKDKEMSDEYKEKCRQRQLGKKYSQESKDKRSKSSIGENNASAKLIPQEIIKIRELYSTGNYTYKQLSIDFNIDKSSIANIIKYKSWKHI